MLKTMEDIEISPYGSLLVYKKNYTSEFIERNIKDKNLRGLRIFALLQDQKLGNINFLEKLDFLEHLDITSLENYNLSVLKYLKNLKSLSLNIPKNISINLTTLKSLNSLTINWRNEISGLEHCKELKEVCLVELEASDLSFLSSLIKIEKITIKTGTVTSLKGVENLKTIQSLIIQNCKRLNSVVPINGLNNLEYLKFDTCPKITDFSSLNDLPYLKDLEITDCKKITSIKFINSIPSLRKLVLLGNTDIEDGDLIPAQFIPEVYYTHRKHYNIEIKNKKEEKRREENIEKIKSLFKK
jgi:hypothetical protein